MYLITLEDEDGCWLEEPEMAASPQEAKRLVLERWPTLPSDADILLYRLHYVANLTPPRPPLPAEIAAQIAGAQA